ncbi:MAG: DUF2062 domain-containing protein [Sandaracinaceae bacterium]
MIRRLWRIMVDQVIGLEDTPHRIAWGVFLGFVVAFTPTVGIQMLLVVSACTLLRANKVAGLPAVWISNPITMVPLYYACWRLGSWVLGTNQDPERGRRLIAQVMGGVDWSWSRILEQSFWVELASALWSIGGELWLGGLIVGLVVGAPFYPLTYWAVTAYRRRKAADRAAEPPPGAPGPAPTPTSAMLRAPEAPDGAGGGSPWSSSVSSPPR